MKTERRFADRLIELKESIGLVKKPYALSVCCALCGLVVLLFLYKPLAFKLVDAANSLREVEAELLRRRAAVSAASRSNVKGKAMPRDQVPLALADLTGKGRELGLAFNSIAPGDLEQTTQAGIGNLPVAFAIESEYQNIGQFLTYVEEFSHSVAEVESLSIRPRQDDLPGVSVDLVLGLYVEI